MNPEEATILPRHVVMAKLMAESEEGVAEDACTLCCDKRASVTLLPCRHVGFCRECAEQMNNCPMCRTTIESRPGASIEGGAGDGVEGEGAAVDCHGCGDVDEDGAGDVGAVDDDDSDVSCEEDIDDDCSGAESRKDLEFPRKPRKTQEENIDVLDQISR